MYISSMFISMSATVYTLDEPTAIKNDFLGGGGYRSLTPGGAGLLKHRGSELNTLKSTFNAKKSRTQVVVVYF